MLVMIGPGIWYPYGTPCRPPAKPNGGAMPDICPGAEMDIARDTACDAAIMSADGGVRAVGEGCGCCELLGAKLGKEDCCGVVR